MMAVMASMLSNVLPIPIDFALDLITLPLLKHVDLYNKASLPHVKHSNPLLP